MTKDPYNARSVLNTSKGDFTFYRLAALEEAGLNNLDKLPY